MRKILLVDDEQNVLNALCRELQHCYEIETFDDPAVALEHCRSTQFDLVIADYKMPDLNGIEFLKQFGQLQPDAARIVLSGNADIDTLIRMINETHLYRFLSKPWEASELLSAIEQALNHRDSILEDRQRIDTDRKGVATEQTIRNDSPFRIALVDNDDYLLKLMSRELSDVNGHESLYQAIQHERNQEKPAGKFKFIINVFHNAQALLTHIRNNSFDLVISAQTLFDMEGIRLLGKVQLVLPDAALILLSNNADKFEQEQVANDAEVQNVIYLHWANSDLRSDARRRAWNLHRLRTAAIQALASGNM